MYQQTSPPENISKTPGRDLLHLLRRRDKLLKDTDADPSEAIAVHKEITHLLTSLSTSIQRIGLLSPSTLEKTQSLDSSHINSSSATSNEGGKKRKRKGGDRANGNAISASQYGIYLDSNAENSNGGSDKVDLEEGRIIMGLCRSLGVGKKREKNEVDILEIGDEPDILGTACQVFTSICRHAIHGNRMSSSIVKDMIGSITVPLLGGLCDVISKLLLQESSAVPLASALVTASSVISLVQTRCSNSKAGEKVLQTLRDTAWKVLNSTADNEVTKAAALLLATLPLAGDASTNSLSALWSKYLAEGILLLQFAISDVFPVNEKDKEGNIKDPETDSIRQDHQAWLGSLNGSIDVDKSADNDVIDAHRRDKFLSRIQALTEYLLALIKMEGYSINRECNVLFVNFPLQSMLDASETLLSFPLAAEIKHRSLSSRLRSSPIDGGLISANAAISIAASMRCCGHILFEAAVSSCRGGVYGKARRIIAISMANLQSSVSRSLLSVVVEGRKVDGRKDGILAQLRGSIPLRIKSVEMFRTVVMALGSGIMSSAASKSVCRGLVLVGGCLLEQIQRCSVTTKIGVDMEEEWGTLAERGTLIEACSNTLASCISTLGGLIPNNVRGTIDSITHTCLSSLYSEGSTSTYAFSQVKQSLLQLGTNSVCMPWGDGGRSTLLGIVRCVALMLRNDPDMVVASTALSTMCALDGLITPRAPALMIPSRETVSDSKTTLSAGDIVEGITAAAVELATAAAKETKQSKKKKTDDKKKRNIPPTESTDDSQKAPVINSTMANNEKTDETKPKLSAQPDHQPIDAADRNNDVVIDMEIDRTTGDITSEAVKDAMPIDQSNGEDINNKADNMQHVATLTPALAVDMPPEKHEESGNESSSLGDFPEIIDEDPDEEDRV